MLKIITTLTMFAVGLLAQSQVSESIQFSPFSKIEVTNGVEIILSQNAEFSMKAETGAVGDLHSLTMKCKNNTLFISKSTSAPVKVYLQAPKVTSIKAANGAIVRFNDEISARNISISLNSGALFHGTVAADTISLIAIGGSVLNIQAKALSLNGYFSGTSKVNLSGTAEYASINSAESSYCHARNFVCKNIYVNADGVSTVKVFSKERLDVSVLDYAKVAYIHFPGKVSHTSDASGSINRMITQN
jgi:hypothetical protein